MSALNLNGYVAEWEHAAPVQGGTSGCCSNSHLDVGEQRKYALLLMMLCLTNVK